MVAAHLTNSPHRLNPSRALHRLRSTKCVLPFPPDQAPHKTRHTKHKLMINKMIYT